MKLQKLENYIKQAKVVAENSPDIHTQVGSILVSKSTGSVISHGFNGYIRGAVDEFIPKTRPEKYIYTLHAENNLITNAARNGVRTDQCFVVQTHSPCPQCARSLFQSGIDEIYYETLYASTMDLLLQNDMKLENEPIGIHWKLTLSPNKDFR